MGIISGGRVIEPSSSNPGIKQRVYYSDGVPSDTNLGYGATPPNGTVAQNLLNGDWYERRAGVWTRMDTL